MPVPTWDQYMAPSLQVLLNGEIKRSRRIVEGAAELLGITDEQRRITIPSGQEQWINLGLSRIYVQAKRYARDNPVGREAIQAFVGALAGNQANQGVFITTSRFARTAIDYAGAIATRVILIDGERLTRLMIRYGVGVQVKRRIEIVEIDEDFFE